MKLRSLEMRWETFIFPIKAGTPININGIEANDGTAIGIIPQDIPSRPMEVNTEIVVGGIFTLADLEKAYGKSYNMAALRNMNGILFYGSDGTPVVDPQIDPYVLPAATAGELGGVKIGSGVSVTSDGTISLSAATAEALGAVKQAANVADAAGDAPTAAEFKAVLDALKAAGIMAADPVSE